jgi:microcin C transport system ATP-binding protein
MTDALLSVRDLSIAFRSGGRETLAVDRISFDIAKGETLALVGESGSGKSVTALSILRLLPYPAARHPSGVINFKGVDLLKLDQRQMRRVRGDDISIVFQEPMTSLNPLHTIEKQIGEILLLHRGLTGQAARERTIEVLTQVGIPDPQMRLKSYPHQLSGGQRQRVMIAMALANEPDLLIADEPTTALDVTVQAQIIALLKDLQARLHMSLLFITHDLGIVRKIAQRVCVMKDGNIVEHGTVARVFAAPEHPYTRALLAAEPKPDPAPPQPDAPVVIETQNLKVWFPITSGLLRKVVGHVKACDGLSIELRKGETLGVVGESGSGKSTLGRAILRLISSEGLITFMGHNLQGRSFKEMRPFRHNMQIVFQDPYGSLSPRMSVTEIIKEGLKVHHPRMSENDRDRRDAVPFSTRILRRPASAYRGSARDRARAELHRARRADQRARHAHSGADGGLATRPAEAAGPHLSVHFARSARGGGAGEPPPGDASWRGGRSRHRRRPVPQSADRLHARVVRRGVQS